MSALINGPLTGRRLREHDALVVGKMNPGTGLYQLSEHHGWYLVTLADVHDADTPPAPPTLTTEQVVSAVLSAGLDLAHFRQWVQNIRTGAPS